MSINGLEIIKPDHLPQGTIRVAIFDFDGTFSTLRCGWEQVMRPLMLEYISGGQGYDQALEQKVDAYIDASTGIQTVYQMQWLAEQVEAAGYGVPGRDAWWYKDEYNRRLMEQVSVRIGRLESGEEQPEQYLVAGAVEFLKALKQAGIQVYLASGTDHKDVVHEATVLGVADFFTEIKGAPERKAACSKEAVLKMILEEQNLPGECLLLVGDGKVEIALGAQCGAYTLGAATREEERWGLNPVKRERLLKAGADVIVGDFTDLQGLLAWINGMGEE